MNPDDPKSLVSTDWLEPRINDPDLRILDGSWHLPDSGRDARSEYEARHIPGAVFFDIDEISDPASPLPHMAPPPELFSSAAGKMGIGNGDQVIVYDSAGLFSAARVWWLFRYMGHFDIAVLDGGLPRWAAEGRPVSRESVRPAERNMKVSMQNRLIRDVSETARASADGLAQIVDARPSGRFLGREPEPRPGLRSGHIPGSVNVPHAAILKPDGTLKDRAELEALFRAAGVDTGRAVITSCGSGVTSAAVGLALEIVGSRSHSLYDGSWAEWGGRGDLPLAAG